MWRQKLSMERKFNERIYTQIAIDKLTILAVYSLTNQNEECAFERLVKECFDLFPDRFCLRRYKQWPDSNRIYLSMMRCRNNGWIVGNEKNGFQITEFGKKTSESILEQLKGNAIIKNRKTIDKRPRERGETIINSIKKSKAFVKFNNNKENFDISEEELREILGVTIETPVRVLKQNFKYCWNICKDYKEEGLLEFLAICKKSLS